jgi:hypothetical protein
MNNTFSFKLLMQDCLTIKSHFAALIFTILLIVFIRLSFPFTIANNEDNTIRLLLECFILVALTVYVMLNNGILPILYLLIIMCLFFLNWLISSENYIQILSYYNKIALTLLLYYTFKRNIYLTTILKYLWIILWIYFASLSIITYIVYFFDILPFERLISDAPYAYYYIGGTGNVLFKNFFGLSIPRYAGFFNEPIHYGLFSALNMLISKLLFSNKRYSRYYYNLSLLSGILTFSYAFAIFSFVHIIFGTLLRRISHLYLNIIFLLAIMVLVFIDAELSNYLPYSSVDDRISRIHNAVNYLIGLSPEYFLFGFGIIPFQQAIGASSSVEIINIFVSRGVFIFFIWLYLLSLNSKYINNMYFLILLYSMFVGFFTSPYFIIGLVMANSVSKFRMTQQKAILTSDQTIVI